MYTSYCSISCALDSLKNLKGVPSIDAAIKNLELSISYAKLYHEKQWSIHWVTSKSSKKKALKQELKSLAFDTYTEFLKAIENLNAFVEEMQKCQPVAPVPSWWDDMLISLNLAHDSILHEHKHQVFDKQLNLFENL